MRAFLGTEFTALLICADVSQTGFARLAEAGGTEEGLL